jgi:hypothetical protein
MWIHLNATFWGFGQIAFAALFKLVQVLLHAV